MSTSSETSDLLDKSILRPRCCPGLIRIGHRGDGGYVVPYLAVDRCRVLLSLGISDNWSFDQRFAELNPTTRVIGVDHSVGPWFITRKTVQYAWKWFYNTLIGNHEKRDKYGIRLRCCVDFYRFFRGPHRHLKKRVSREQGPGDVRLSELIPRSEESKSPDVFIKMDIEGSEYEVLDEILAHGDQIRCVAAELHNLDTRTDEFNRFVARLSEDFTLVHIHGNNYAPYDERNDFPSTVEITWVNRRIWNESQPSTRSYPVEGLDFPNDFSRPDHPLRLES